MTANFEELHHRLEKERERLVLELKQKSTETSATRATSEGSPFGKREEEAAEVFEIQKSAAVEGHFRAQLSEIEHALQKFESGTYGLCDECGQSISRERLEALPQASLCLNCKARQAKEKKNRFPQR